MAGSLPDRARRARLWLAGMLLLTVTAVPAADDRPRAVRDPHYGEVLFDFYQQNYFGALGSLMTAQHFARLPSHADEAELLRGGLVLSYGLHVEAGKIFERLIDAGAPPAVADRAWFFLAKIRYQRGYLALAERALASIRHRLPGELEDERQILHAILLIGQERYQEAAERLAAYKSKSDWLPYGRYNLGVALVRAGDTERGIALLDKIGREAVVGDELRSLRDKANVALGYTFLQNGQAPRARDALERVRLNGLLSNKALLGMGWAHSALDQQERALVYWNELQQRDVLDSAVQESLLAVPYALGKLGAYRQSLQQYEQALDIYVREMARLDTAIAAIRAGKLNDRLLQENPGGEVGWMWKLEQLPDAPETHYLALLMAGHDFQEALKNYRDLHFQVQYLQRWSSSAAAFQDLLDTRRRAYTERLPAVQSPRVQAHARLQAERDRLAAEITRVEQEDDAEALARDKERAQLARLERIQAVMARGGADDDTRERVRVLRGLLRWDLETDYPARLWSAKKSLHELDALLETNAARRAALERARQTAPLDFDAFDTRIRALVPRINRLRDKSLSLAAEQREHLNNLAVAELLAQRERLATYQTQVRFAVAQIYDRAAGQAPESP